MVKHRAISFCAYVSVLLFAFCATAFAKGPSENARVVEASLQPDHVFFQPTSEIHSYKIVFVGPDGVYEYSFAGDETAFLGLVAPNGDMLPDGLYKYEVTASPLRENTRLTAKAPVASQRGIRQMERIESTTGVFTILEGEIVLDENETEQLIRVDQILKTDGTRGSGSGSTLGDAGTTTSTGGDTGTTTGSSSGGTTTSSSIAVDVDPGTRDQVFLDDIIVDGSACIGFDCVNGEAFGFDTIRMKENNLRIRAQDTSNSASFPTNDWMLTFNDSGNGGQNKFSVDDVDGGRTPFTIEASAPSHSLYIDDGGRIGLGTSTPVVEMHIKDGDTPTVRLEQDGSSGFGAQTWDMASNETNFFIRDASNGSTLPFRIIPSAPSNSVYIDADGDIGMGTSAPAADLHITQDNVTAAILVGPNTASPAFVVDDEGRVGIGTDPGTAHLAVQADAPAVISLNDTRNLKYNFTSNAAGLNIGADGSFTVIQATTNNNVRLGQLLGFVVEPGGDVTSVGDISALSHTTTSDVNMKEDFEVVDPLAVLDKVIDMPVTQWRFKSEVDPEGKRHIGPMAQDFYAAFGLGTDDKHISTTDINGVTMAAIQGLNQKVESKDDEIDALKARIAKLEALVNQLAADK